MGPVQSFLSSQLSLSRRTRRATQGRPADLSSICGSATEALNAAASSGPSILTGSGEMSNVANDQSRASSESRPGLGEQSPEIPHITADELAAKIEPELLTIMRTPDYLNKRIILIEELEKFWHAKDRDRFYRRWFDEADENHRQLLRIISILILARFRRWDEFYEIFVMNEKRKTRDRPFQLDDLSQTAFLGPADGQQFYQHQWIFWPLVIRERREPYILAESEQERRLPFIADRTKIGEGATADVFMETIAPFHLEYSFRNRKSVNYEPKLVACKILSKKAIPPPEFDNVVKLRGSLVEHNRIMTNIATIVTDSSYNILYDVAAYDLEKFLVRDHNTLPRLDSAPRGHNMSCYWKPADLIKECFHLADALDFLHSRLYCDDGEVSCTHNDLKPENILIFYPFSPDERYPVGQWKIADFGISGVKARRSEDATGKPAEMDPPARPAPKRTPSNNLLNVTSSSETHRGNGVDARASSLSNTKSRRDPGRYTAPEVVGLGLDQVDARKADIWSFGCILAEVLVFGIRQSLVSELRKVCQKPAHKDMRFYDESTHRVKPGILKWLSGISREFPVTADQTREWIDESVPVIRSILEPEYPLDRPTGRDLRNTLKNIHKRMDHSHAFPPDASWMATWGMGEASRNADAAEAQSTHSDHSSQSSYVMTQSPANSPPLGATERFPETPRVSLTIPEPIAGESDECEVKIPTQAARGIRRWAQQKGSARFWVSGIPADKVECQQIWRSTADHLKQELLMRLRDCKALAYHRPAAAAADAQGGGLSMVRGLIQQLDPTKDQSGLWKVTDALRILGELLEQSPQPVAAIFYGLNPDESGGSVRAAVDMLFKMQNSCDLKLIFFTEKGSDVLERRIEKQERYDSTTCEPLKEPLSKLLPPA